MDIGLCMMVKNEEANILPCLEPIIDLFTEAVIIDTGSTDRTCELLREQLNIKPVFEDLDPQQCFSFSQVRNQGFEQLQTPWIMSLDADERIAREELEAVLCLKDSDLPDGLFCAWNTDCGDGELIEDYKLSLFRRGFYKQGLIHDTVQPDFRLKQTYAEWTDLFYLQHLPPAQRMPHKNSWNKQRLCCAQKHQPDWLRYHWFLGYMCYRQGEFTQAVPYLQALHQQRPRLFPVESLNASMVLASIYAQQEKPQETEQVLQAAWQFLQTVKHDFEVKVNYRLPNWIQQAIEYTLENRLEYIRSYAFPY